MVLLAWWSVSGPEPYRPLIVPAAGAAACHDVADVATSSNLASASAFIPAFKRFMRGRLGFHCLDCVRSSAFICGCVG